MERFAERFGKWNVIYKRSADWCSKSYFEFIFQSLKKSGLQQIIIDSTSVKVHQAASVAEKKGHQSTDRPTGAITTKIHTLCDAFGNPLKYILSPGQTHDSQVANDLIDNVAARALLADKAYYSQHIIAKVKLIL